MKIGIVLPSFSSNRKLVDKCFRSLALTETLQESTRLLLIIRSGTGHLYKEYVTLLNKAFNVIVQVDEIGDAEKAIECGAKIFKEDFAIDHVVAISDEQVFDDIMWLWKVSTVDSVTDYRAYEKETVETS